MACMVHVSRLKIASVNVFSKMDLLSEERREMIESFLEADTRTILDQEPPSPWAIEHRALTQALASLLDDYSLVKFVPLELRDEESMANLLLVIDNAIQYGEDLDVKDRFPELEDQPE